MIKCNSYCVVLTTGDVDYELYVMFLEVAGKETKRAEANINRAKLPVLGATAVLQSVVMVSCVQETCRVL